MAGFFGNLFSKDKTQSTPNEPSEAFYLDPDAAKTYGDIDYMRTPKKVKHTFPKGKVDGVYEAKISAMEVAQGNASNGSAPAAPTPSPTEPTIAKRPADMDLFRKMVRDMKK